MNTQFYSHFRRHDGDVKVLDILVMEAGAFYVMDHG